MKALVFYAYPPEPDGQSLQGHALYLGLKGHGVNAIPCHFKDSIQKDYYLKHLQPKPQVSFGIGFWGNVPEIVREPKQNGVIPVPWFNADGWVANYKEDFEKLDLMFTTSAWVKSIYERDGIDVSKIVPMHIGIDTDTFKPLNNPIANRSIKKMLGIEDHEKMILTVGGDVTSKGAQEMIKALAEVNKEYKDWKYVCKSWPSRCAEMWREKEMALVEELGLTDKVIFLDDAFSPEFMSDLLNASDIYAGPSRIEGFGMIQVEAMACGKPVIAINKGGPAETILHNKTGLLAGVAEEIMLNQEWAYPSMGYPKKTIVKFDKPKCFGYRADINDLKEFTLKLLNEPETCKKMGEAGRIHAVNNFDYRVISKKMLDITRDRLKID
ncbi:MAG: glycosyltransferase family 4 protein [Candidatus Pacearchaeota archaeon]|jgi:glycosyltransferase involved in cell wall biosynthesis